MSRQKQKKLRLSPSWLPVVRDHLVKEGRRQADNRNLHGSNTMEVLADFYGEMDTLQNAPLWWVGRDMKTLCVDTVNEGPMPPATPPPTVTGFIVFEDGFAVTRLGVLVKAVSWETVLGHDGGTDLMLRLFSDDPRATGSLIDRQLPIAPLGGATEDESVNAAVAALLSVAFALMDQPSVTSVRHARWDRTAEGPRPASLPEVSKVKMIVLRRPPTARDPEKTAEGGREYHHRWIVRGHYRNQAYGPNHSLRRRQWIPPYVAGPADAPLIEKTAVRVWRRL